MVAKSADYHWWSGASYCVWRRPLFRGCVIDIAANIKFICGEEVDLCLLEAGEDWTWKKKACCSVRIMWIYKHYVYMRSTYCNSKRTVFHFLGELVVLQQRAHITSSCAVHDGLHVCPGLTQTEVKIADPEDLIKSCGDISYDREWHSFMNKDNLTMLPTTAMKLTQYEFKSTFLWLMILKIEREITF